MADLVSLASWWSKLSRPQQLILGAGVPLAAGAAVVGNLRDREPSAPAGPTPGPALDVLPDNADLVANFGLVRDQIALDTAAQLLAFEDEIGESLDAALADLEALLRQEEEEPPPPPPPPPTPTPPPPSPDPQLVGGAPAPTSGGAPGEPPPPAPGTELSL